jgi:hypothetical protein
MPAAEGEDGGSGWQQRRTATMAMVDEDIGDGGQQQQQTTTVADNDGMQDQAADYKGEGGERAANNNGIRAWRAESVKK